MQYLKINNLSFSYTSNNKIFKNLNLLFEKGWTSVVGANGSGKTTLLKLISKELKYENGTIHGNEFVYYCNQKLDEPSKYFEEFIYSYDKETFRIKELLNIRDDMFYNWQNLSYGEKKKIQVAIALYQKVDVLLLDEPTNHLDSSTKEALLNTLKNYEGIGVLISHDREVLDKLCSNTILIENKTIFTYKTNYSIAINEFHKMMNLRNKENEKNNIKIKNIEKNIQLQKEKVSQSKSKLSKKNINKKDKDSKEKINLAKLTGKDKHDSRLISTLHQKHQQFISKKIEVEKDFETDIKIERKEISKKQFNMTLKEIVLKLGERKSLQCTTLIINRNDKIGIIGNNGVGKSTYLRYIFSQLSSKENIFYLPQEIDDNQIKNLYEEIELLDNKKKGKIFTFIKKLSLNPEQLLRNKELSPGEIRKLFIAKALLEEMKLIILDEPTNHMDIDSIKSIELALKSYDNALILVSHDNIFMNNIVNIFWKIVESESVENKKNTNINKLIHINI